MVVEPLSLIGDFVHQVLRYKMAIACQEIPELRLGVRPRREALALAVAWRKFRRRRVPRAVCTVRFETVGRWPIWLSNPGAESMELWCNLQSIVVNLHRENNRANAIPT